MIITLMLYVDIHKQTFDVVSFISHLIILIIQYFENLDWIIMVQRWQKAFLINRVGVKRSHIIENQSETKCCYVQFHPV